MRWQLQTKRTISTQDQLLKRVMILRKIKNQAEFLHPPPPMKYTPRQFGVMAAELNKAVKRIKRAIKDQEKVLIYGDYDADGMTATSILWLTLNHLGLQAQPFIPDRLKHGYGVSQQALQEIFSQEKPDLIITVDNGIVAHEALEWACRQQVEVIVTDHHQPIDNLPPAAAVVHSTQISGAAVAWVLARELAAGYSINLLDLVTISTVADQMKLVGVNRSLVKHGLEQIQKSPRNGLKELLGIAGTKPVDVTTGTIGFMIAPRLNAAGRIAHGLDAVRLLCTQSISSSRKIAKSLNQLNQTRQDLTSTQYELAEQMALKQSKEHLLFVESPAFHEGIIGLIAGKLTEKFHKPSIVVASEGKVVKASARSVPGVNVTDLIRQVESELLSVGGHQLAAGFSARSTKLKQVQSKLQQIARQEICAELLEPVIEIEAQLSAQLLTVKTARSLTKLEPFGLGNPEPVLAVRQLQVVEAKRIGSKNDHLKLAVRANDSDYSYLEAVGWGMGEVADRLVKDAVVDLAFCLQLNCWNGREKVQLMLKDVVVSEKG